MMRSWRGSVRRWSEEAGLLSLGCGVRLALGVVALGLVVGCASPGPPRPPSLQVPGVVKGLEAERRAGEVELWFTLPKATTDKLPLKTASVAASLCRGVDAGPCRPLPGMQSLAYAPGAAAKMVDVLPAELAVGAPRLLTYKVRLVNPGHRDRGAEWSDAVYAAAGAAPPPVAGLGAQGSRLGIVLSWQAAADDGSKVVLRRDGMVAKKREAKLKAGAPKLPQAKRVDGDAAAKAGSEKSGPEVVLMDAGAGAGGTSSLDTTVVPDEPYKYAAERVRSVNVSGHELELHSAESGVVAFTLHDTYPPPAPLDLSVAGFVQGEGAAAVFAVDLIWQPVDDANLAGYVVYRQAVDAGGLATGESVRLTKEPVALPAFHDASADAKQAYRYSVTAVDHKGNESAAATATLSAQAQ